MDLGTFARSTGVYDAIEPFYSRRQVRRWQTAGSPIPSPSAVKREVLREYADLYETSTLVETGTYKADTVRALRKDFDAIHSIEIAPDFYAAALRRCKRQANATIHLGDSGEVLKEIVPDLDTPALFWLDAHYSGGKTGGAGGAPIIAELQTILGSGAGHVVLIDDMREFGNDPEYPALDRIEDAARASGYKMIIAADIARLVPPASN